MYSYSILSQHYPLTIPTFYSNSHLPHSYTYTFPLGNSKLLIMPQMGHNFSNLVSLHIVTRPILCCPTTNTSSLVLDHSYWFLRTHSAHAWLLQEALRRKVLHLYQDTVSLTRLCYLIELRPRLMHLGTCSTQKLW